MTLYEKTKKESSFLKLIEENRIIEIKEYMSSIDNDITFSHNSPFRTACGLGHFELVKLLLNDKRVDPTDFFNEAIVMATYSLNSDVVNLLLKDGRVDVTYDYSEAFRRTVDNKDLSSFHLFIKNGKSDFSSFESYPIIRANGLQSYEMVEALWNIKSVREALKKDNADLYKTFNKKYITYKLKDF
jgi:hypothetical protein